MRDTRLKLASVVVVSNLLLSHRPFPTGKGLNECLINDSVHLEEGKCDSWIRLWDQSRCVSLLLCSKSAVIWVKLDTNCKQTVFVSYSWFVIGFECDSVVWFNSHRVGCIISTNCELASVTRLTNIQDGLRRSGSNTVESVTKYYKVLSIYSIYLTCYITTR